MIFEIYGLIHTLMTVYIWVIIIASFLSFVRPDPNNPLVQALYRLTEPAFAFIRRKFPFVMVSGFVSLATLIPALCLYCTIPQRTPGSY